MGRRQERVYHVEPEEFPQDFPERLDRFRQAAGLSWRELARRLKVNARIVRRWKAGTKPGPGHLVNLLELAAGMGLLHHLLRGVEEPSAFQGGPMTRYRQGHMEKVCRGCGRVYYRQFRRNSGREGWCGGRCYMRTYRRSLGEAANGQPAGAARAGRDEPSGPLVCHQDTLEGTETVTESGEIIGFNLDLVAERPLVAQTRFEEDGGIGVDWRGRCWAWLNGDEAPALAEVVVNDAETARLLFPGQVRRVRAMVRAVETPAGRVAALEVLTDLGWEPRTEPCAAARGLHEGGEVRILGGTVQQGLSGKVGTLLRYTSATVEVDGRRYGVGVRGLEPVSGENGPEESGETEEAAVGLD